MRKAPKHEVWFGIIALAFIYAIVSNNASITGFAVSSPFSVSLLSPADSSETSSSSVIFMFQYSEDVMMKECSLFINNQFSKSMAEGLFPEGNSIKAELKPGNYIWQITCIDNQGLKIESATRRLVVTSPEEELGLKVIKAPGTGFIYKFELYDGLVMNLNSIMGNDIIRMQKAGKDYDVYVIGIMQDYSKATEYADLLLKPSGLRMMVNPGETVSLDLDQDGLMDVELSLSDITYGRAYLTAVSLEWGTQPGNKPAGLVSTSSVSDQVSSGWKNFPKTFLIGIIIIMVIAVALARKHGKSTEENYVEEVRSKAEFAPGKAKQKKKAAKKASINAKARKKTAKPKQKAAKPKQKKTTANKAAKKAGKKGSAKKKSKKKR